MQYSWLDRVLFGFHRDVTGWYPARYEYAVLVMYEDHDGYKRTHKELFDRDWIRDSRHRYMGSNPLDIRHTGAGNYARGWAETALKDGLYIEVYDDRPDGVGVPVHKINGVIVYRTGEDE